MITISTKDFLKSVNDGGFAEMYNENYRIVIILNDGKSLTINKSSVPGTWENDERYLIQYTLIAVESVVANHYGQNMFAVDGEEYYPINWVEAIQKVVVARLNSKEPELIKHDTLADWLVNELDTTTKPGTSIINLSGFNRMDVNSLFTVACNSKFIRIVRSDGTCVYVGVNKDIKKNTTTFMINTGDHVNTNITYLDDSPINRLSALRYFNSVVNLIMNSTPPRVLTSNVNAAIVQKAIDESNAKGLDKCFSKLKDKVPTKPTARKTTSKTTARK